MARATVDKEDKERVSLYVDGELYRTYVKEMARRKIDERQRGVSVNSLVVEAMTSYAKKFK